jgi:hypothetical protein
MTIKALDSEYNIIQKNIKIKQGSIALKNATQFTTNKSRPLHKWFHFKEGFSADLLSAAKVKTDFLMKEDTVFIDPFCGSGTTLVAGDINYHWRSNRIGFEVNPFIAFVADLKVQWRKYDPQRFRIAIDKILEKPLDENRRTDTWPNLSTLKNDDIFMSSKISSLLDALDRVHSVATPERDLLLLGIATAAEQLGFYRKDGRALRIIKEREELDRRRELSPSDVLHSVFSTYEADLWNLQALKNNKIGYGKVILGDGRKMDFPENVCVRPGDVSLMAYSPPYLNHIDYTEVYKVELWLLGYIKSREEMRTLREKTLRSHASIIFDEQSIDLPEKVKNIIEIASKEITSTGNQWHKRFPATASGYFQDIKKTLEKQYLYLKGGSQAICVVANSSHGSGEHRIPIAVDLLIACIAEEIGFSVDKILIARQMSRRDHLNKYLRESVLILRKPIS